MKPEEQYDAIFKTDIAVIGLQFEGSRLTKIDYLSDEKDKVPGSKIAEIVKNKIENYLQEKSQILKIEVKLNVTSFQQKVLKQLQKIPYGETRTYGEIAKILKTSPRAVGNACRNNPVPIVIPCHRVVAVSGLGGYDGATQGERLNIKYQLLKRETAI